ncbi:hypothetical protein ND861_12980 [Leptospira sp. 2 VSF19]|uniref:Uncharacterized protein n=1 Tax=Leptospira soteropolitanensis TaxID=2950025 RepID=A0AAW5VF56_9LEPT|nr:hypothetical protein [Leptospira soteropolitanensis]MCW7493556.1 hypothetical protein [Leptospira soteropolitanensis]MCW7500913.1 hypothetical protein [Leptospira soteropolitanensis]MCW7523407.1 hypothetical protein [Leptospira soteropolitanensis]MCW7527268.1 hypothetical protein [Leptospira soteropolitanensis]MCW7531125.1 hypothetical protein [Leptospira soteropolitanensis]
MKQDEFVELSLLDQKELSASYRQGDFVALPNNNTKFFRTFFPWQLVRFIWINIRMVVMIFKSHH